MNITIKAPKKKVVAALTVVIVLLIALIGTFAWNSLNQSRINVFQEVIKPNVNLHDDFHSGPNKDVYVENSGDVPIYVRVMLSEFLQTENRGSLVAMSRFGDEEGDDQLQIARDTWYPHNGLHMGTGDATSGNAHQCYINETLGDMWPHGTNFHDYYEWVMGSSGRWIYYKPATPEQRGVDDDGNPLPVLNEAGEPVIGSDGQPLYVTPSVVSDPLTETHGDAAEWYYSEMTRILGKDPESASPEEEAAAMEQLGVKKTLETVKVITMAEWKTAGFSKGDFWVVDADGWCYWANPLQPGDTTGLLLDEVKRNGDKLFDSNAEYAINVWLQAVDESEFIDTLMGTGGGITNDAKLLLHFAAGNLLNDSNSDLFKKNRDGTYYQVNSLADVDPNGGDPSLVLGERKENAKDFVLLGADTINLNVTVANTNKFEIGSYFTITDLEWDGDDYNKWDTGDKGTEFLWNISVLDNLDDTKVESTNNDAKYVTMQTGGAQVYQLTGVTYGVDDLMYLKIAPLTKPGAGTDPEDYAPDHTGTQYIGSAKKNGAGDYAQLNPGFGPYVFIYPANTGGAIGTAKDMRGDPSVEFDGRYFYHIGAGVYVETDSKAGTSAIDSNYYFAGAMLTKTAVKNQDIGEVFPLILAEGDPIDVSFNTDANGVQRISGTYTKNEDDTNPADGKSDGKYTFSIVTGTNGQLYVYLGTPEDGYIGIGSLYATASDTITKFLGTVNSDTRVWAGPNGIGTSGDSAKQPDLFGQGTAADPFKVRSEKELIYIAQQVASGNTFTGVYFEMTDNIDLKVYGDSDATDEGSQNAADNFRRIGYRNRPFKGIFDGKGHTISGLEVSAGSDECYALFGWLEGTVRNVKMTGVNISGNYQCYAGIAGHTNGNALIENCEVSGTISSGTTGNSGGIAGYIMGNTKIIGCTSNVNITMNGSHGGGIVGYINGSGNTVENCTNTGKITLSGGNYHGGIVGFNNGGTVKGCTNSGAVIGTTGQYIGGIVGETYGPVIDCVNETTGVVGGDAANNRRSHSGGIVGVNYSTVQDCENKAAVYGTNYTGGVVGLMNRNTAKITGSSNTAAVDATGNNTGGVVGYTVAGSTVENCFNTGDVKGVSYTGGLIGANYGIAQTSYVTGGMTASTSYNGGIVGYNFSGSTLSRCYFDGTKSSKTVQGGTNYTGGITGVQQGTVTNCYAWGNVSGQSYVGGVSGYNSGTYATSYHDKGTVSGTSIVGGAIGRLYGGTATLIEAMTTRVTGTGSNYVGRVFGQHYSGTFASCFYASSNFTIEGEHTTSGSNGNGTVARPTSSSPWTGGDFNVSKNIWFYNAQNNLVLKGVGPNGQ